MQHVAVTAQPRAERLTKGQRKDLRRNGTILASVYGKGRESVPVTLSAADLSRVFSSETGTNTLVDLKIGDTSQRSLARITAIEMEPITMRFRHVGLHIISANESQKATVPIEIVGEPEAVHNHEGIIESTLNTVEISAMPENLVGHVTLDVSNMEMDQVLHASDLELPQGVELLTASDATVAALHRTPEVLSDEAVEATGDDEAVSGVTRDSSSLEEDLIGV
jgi:large subunit ribosomal protein L25